VNAALQSPAREADEGWRRAASSLGISAGLHVVLALTGWLQFAIAPVHPPVLAASRGEISLVVQRPLRGSTRTAAAAEESIPRPEAVLSEPRRAEVGDPDRAVSTMDEPRIERSAASDDVVGDSFARIDRDSLPDERMSGEQGVKAPRLAPGVGRPKYPAICRSGRHRPGGCEGRGVYDVHIDEKGRALEVDVVKSAGCALLDRSAVLFFLQRARFMPNEASGAAAEWRGTIGVVFSLEQEDERP
jgi:TonB family protein